MSAEHATKPQHRTVIRKPSASAEESPLAINSNKRELLAHIEAFDAWFTALRRGQNPSKGSELARERRKALKTLIALDPETALQHAFPRTLRSELPPQVAVELETPVDAFGSLDVLMFCSAMGSSVSRKVTIGETRYEAYTYGRRLDSLSKDRVPIHGIVIDDQLALSNQTYRRLENGEGGSALQAAGLNIIVGNVAQAFASEVALATWNEHSLTTERIPNPGISDPKTAAEVDNSGWVNGAKSVLWIRAEYPDDPGSPISDQQISEQMETVNSYFLDVSRSKTSFKTTIIPGVLRIAHSKISVSADPQNGQNLVSADALQLAREYDAANGNTGLYNPDKYDRWIVIFKSTPNLIANNLYWTGLATVGGKGLWLNGNNGASISAHELGHNQGLWHSHAWTPASSNSSLKPGTHEEYGDVFDVMGYSDSIPSGHFNTKQKSILGYLQSTEIAQARSNETIRLYRSDHRQASGVQAIQIEAGDAYDYWLEKRNDTSRYGTTTTANRLLNGILIHWGKRPAFTDGNGTYLLDATPGSIAGMYDAPLTLNETFIDPDYGICITPTATGGSSPNEYIDVQVSYGATGNNHNPSLAIAVPSGPLAVRTDIEFIATASDPDGDSIQYRWNFGDSQTTPTTSRAVHRWIKGGVYTVSCTVIDGKGGIATKNLSVTLRDPLTSWNRRGEGITSENISAITFANGQFVAVGSSGCVLRSGDGFDWTKHVSSEICSFPKSLSYDGKRFIAAGIHSNGGWKEAISSSSDGLTWTLDYTGSAKGVLNSVACGNGMSVVVGNNGVILFSGDGRKWKTAQSGTSAFLNEVRYQDGYFFVIGDKGTILRSTDGNIWQKLSLASSDSLSGIVRHNGQWWVYGTSKIWHSTDGLDWKISSSAVGSTPIHSITNLSLGLVMAPNTNAGSVALSENGETWDNINLAANGAAAGLNSIAEGAGSIIAVGTHGQIFQCFSILQESPAIVNQPHSLVTEAGKKLTFSVEASGSGPLSYQWFFNGVAIPSATQSTLVIENAMQANTGTYTVTVRNTVGSVTSESASLLVNNSMITAISVRALAGTDDQTLILGVIFSGGSTKPMVLRAIGPNLATSLQDYMRDPRLVLFNLGGTQILENDDWVDSDILRQSFARVGMSPLPRASKDAAIVQNLSEAGCMMHVKSTDGGTGITLAEVYDAQPDVYERRLSAVSVRNQVGVGDKILIAGLIISGNSSKKLIIRGLGPNLAPLLSNYLRDPLLKIDDILGGRKIGENDNWQDDPSVGPAMAKKGFIPLDSGSKDAAMLVELSPGAYSVSLSGKDGGIGIGLIEVYEAE